MEVMKPNLSFDQWREKIIRIFYILIGLIFIVEVVVFIVLRPFGLLDEGFTGSQYLIEYIAIPTVINLIVVLGCHRINKMKIHEKIKNFAIPFTSSVIAGVIAFIHCDITSILTVFSIPVFLTVLFYQKKMTRIITIINLVLLLFSAIHTSQYAHVPVYYYLDVVVAITLLITAFLISSVLIAYNKANYNYIYSSYKTQITLTEQARNDSLTGLYNQRTFHTLLKATMEKSRKNRAPMSLAIIDLDDFKEINDTYGHLAGDQVLLHFTALMKQQCEENDAYISRYGGDEFAVIFPKASKELAYLRLESLRQRCRQVPSIKTGTSQISFSAGISHFIDGEMNETLLFHQADSALYQAKENGKGQTIVYQQN
ncbi:MAG: GGDEF domain-containing protein [Bacillota bacterium]